MKPAADTILAILIATSFAAGLNVYATVATLGLLARSEVMTLPPALHPVESWWVIGACLALFLIEFFADKVPAFDLIWNALHTFVRVPVAALLAYGARPRGYRRKLSC
jgi:multisubunit Na+/H+ antiporter MnhG subunit